MLNKAIQNGKERRKPYQGAKSISCSCRNHGGCPYCESNRKYNNAKKLDTAKQKEKDFNLSGNFGKVIFLYFIII